MSYKVVDNLQLRRIFFEGVNGNIWICVFVFIAFLLATQLNNLAEENLLVTNCVCKVKKTTTSTLADGKYVLAFVVSSHPFPCFYLFSASNPLWPYFYVLPGLW